MNAPSDYESVLQRDNSYRALFIVVKADVHERGVDKELVIETMTELMLRLRVEGRELEEDAVADVLDCLCGFCPKHSRI